MKKYLPIILGADENAYGCARQFYEIDGTRSVLLCTRPLSATDHSSILYRYVVKDLDRPSVFAVTLLKTVRDAKALAEKVLVIPCSDYYARLLSDNKGVLSKWIDSPILSEEVFERINGKVKFSKLCNEIGLPHPKTVIGTPSELLHAEIELAYPIVLKPANSNSFEYLHLGLDGKKKVYFCKDRASLSRALEGMITSGYGENVVLQRYIGGDERQYRVVNSYSDKNGRVRLIGVGRPLFEYRDERMTGNYAAVRCMIDKSLCDAVKDALEKIGYVGFANFDVKIDPESGEYIFLELNPRQGRSSYYMSGMRAGLMRELYEDTVLGKPYGGVKYAEGDAIWVGEPISALRGAMKRKGLDADELKKAKLFSAIGLTFDMSLPRAATVIRRYAGAVKRGI